MSLLKNIRDTYASYGNENVIGEYEIERLEDRAEIVYGLECKLASSAVTMRPNLVMFRKYDADGVLVSHFR